MYFLMDLNGIKYIDLKVIKQVHEKRPKNEYIFSSTVFEAKIPEANDSYNMFLFQQRML